MKSKYIKDKFPGSGFETLEEKLGIEASVVDTGIVYPEKAQHTRTHLHINTLHLTYTKSGHGSFMAGADSFEMTPGTVSVVYPNESHSFHPDEKDPFENLNLKIYCHGTLPCKLPRAIHIKASKRRKTEKLFYALIEIYNANDSVIRNLREMSLLLELFAELLENRGDEPEKQYINSKGNAFGQIIAQLQRPGAAFPSISRLAKEAGMSTRTFTDVFRKVTGLSPKKFFIASRMSYAEQLIKYGHLTIKEAAAKCGYSQISNFSRDYRTFFSKTPKQNI